jgi:hypothetical protein
MVRVLNESESTTSKEWKEKCICGSCSSPLEVAESDLTRFKGSGGYIYPGGSWDCVIFRCPCCEKVNNIKIPEEVLSRLPARGGLPLEGVCEAKLRG